jgi:MinD-like ATPase involved in chromosome partitioning or flagellar assembly
VVIRDLRAAPPTPPAVSGESLAFARGAVARPRPIPAAPAIDATQRAFTIAVTAPRQLACKRGVAAHLAAEIAGSRPDARVCLVDADIESRDIGTRFGVTGPLLLDVAKRIAFEPRADLEAIVARATPPNLWVLPTRPPEPALAPMVHSKTSSVLGALRACFDVVVIDAPIGLGIDIPEVGQSLLRHVDSLVVSVTADAAACGGAIRYLNALIVAIDLGKMPGRYDANIVLTGSDHDGSRTLFDEEDIETKLQDLPVVAWIPQLWGRQRPDGPMAPVDPALRDALRALVDDLMPATDDAS